MDIKQVSEEMELTADELRYYERIGLIPPIKRTKEGKREYTEDDLKWIDFTMSMCSAGLSKESLIDYVRLSTEGHYTVEARRDLLIDESEQLEERIESMTTSLYRLQGEIKNYNLILRNGG